MTATDTTTLTAWLLDRIAEDEAVAREHIDSLGAARRWVAQRLTAECASKRAIVAMHWDPVAEWDLECDLGPAAMEMFPCLTLRHLAAVYADQPGYRDEWAV